MIVPVRSQEAAHVEVDTGDVVSVPADADTSALRATLEDLANDLMVDINFDELAVQAAG